MRLMVAKNNITGKEFLIIKRSWKKKTRKAILMLVVVMVVHMKGRSG